MSILASLSGVVSTLVWSVFLTGLFVFIYFSVKFFQSVELSVNSKKDINFGALRSILVIVPLAWVVLNFNSDANYIAGLMFSFWLPFVIAGIVFLGAVEMHMYGFSKVE